MTSEPPASLTRWAALALICLPLTGCIAADDEGLVPGSLLVDDPGFDGAWTWPDPSIANGDGQPAASHPFVADPSRAPRYVERLLPGAGAEPNIGVTSTGAIFVTSGDTTFRSRDQGASWDPVHELESPNHPISEDRFDTADPMLWVDPYTDRVYVDHMSPPLLCTHLSWSDDEGETWTQRPLACGTPILDHQKVATALPAPGPLGLPSPPNAFPSVLYVCVNKMELGTWCAVSHDGGATYPVDRQVMEQDIFCYNINGHPASFPDGSVVLPMGGFGSGDGCQRPLTVFVTEDNGVTWDRRTCDPDLRQVEIDPDVTVTPDGTAYILFRDKDQRVHLARTTDKFRTCETFDIAPPEHTLNVFTAITSGDDGRIAMAYLGTRDPQLPGATPNNATQGSTWHLYLTTSLDADTPNPTFHTQQVSPEEDPVQRGCVWLKGGSGGPQGCRNLLDFIDASHGPDGRVVVAFTDGCTPRTGCTGAPEKVGFQTRDRQVSVAVQVEGEGLFADPGLVAVLDLERPRPGEDR